MKNKKFFKLTYRTEIELGIELYGDWTITVCTHYKPLEYKILYFYRL